MDPVERFAILQIVFAEERLFALLGAAQQGLVVRAFVELGLADHLSAGRSELEELATTTGSHPASLGRMMRAAAAVGLCAVDDRGVFSLTAMGELLRTGDPSSSAAWTSLMTGPWLVHPWEKLAEAVRSGRAAFSEIHGMGFWEYVAAHPKEGAIFDSAMTGSIPKRAATLIEAVDLSKVRTVVDVGGGQGLLIAALLAKSPGLRGIVADRPEVLAGARPVLEAAGLADRVELVPTDFFTTVPPGGDIYLLSRILHDWPDPEAAAILRSCRQAMTRTSRLYVMEEIVPELDDRSPEDLVALALKDLNMLVLVGGQERTASEYATLLAAASLSVNAVMPGDGCDVIEATPE